MINRPHLGITTTDKMLERIAELEAENERLTARNEHLEKRFGYLEGDWERRNHIIAGLTAENERLTAVVEASKDYLSDHSNESEQSLFEALAAVEEKDDE